MSMPYSAYVPCFNNADTIRRAVESVQAQTPAPDEVIVIDDGSTDESSRQVRDLAGVRIVRHDTNIGRGAARARAMREARHELVLCCDATNVLAPDFAAKLLARFEEPRVAAAFGRIIQPKPRNATERWRGRHLFKLEEHGEFRRGVVLSTFGTIVRAKPVRDVGGYNPALRHSEDSELGGRLLHAGYDVIHEPQAELVSIATNSLPEVLERYWRWYAGAEERVSWRGYWKNIGYSVRAMAARDLRRGDVGAALISLVCPHYQFWKSRPAGFKRQTSVERMS